MMDVLDNAIIAKNNSSLYLLNSQSNGDLPVNSLKHPRPKPIRATFFKDVSLNPIKLPAE
jgi:hypothetical protein